MDRRMCAAYLGMAPEYTMGYGQAGTGSVMVMLISDTHRLPIHC